MRPHLPLRTVRSIVTAGALGFATILAAAAPAAAKADSQGAIRIAVSAKSANVSAGRHAEVRGAVRSLGAVAARRTADAPRTVLLQVSREHGWGTVARARTGKRGAYRLLWRPNRPGRYRARIRVADSSASRSLGAINAYRRAFASWYGPGLFGNKLGCGGRLTPGTLGVANKTLPCGAALTLRYRGRTLRVRVVDRGPYVAGREFDLTAATKRALGFGSTGYVLTTR